MEEVDPIIIWPDETAVLVTIGHDGQVDVKSDPGVKEAAVAAMLRIIADNLDLQANS